MKELAGTDRTRPPEPWPPVVAAITLLLAIIVVTARAPEPSLALPTPPPVETSPRPAQPVTIATISQGDVWLYDVASNATNRLTFDGTARPKSTPKFQSARFITYLAEHDRGATAIWRREISPNAEPQVIVTGRPILAYDIRGNEIAYLTRDRSQRSVLRLWDGERSRTLRTFAGDLDREFDDTDDQRVEWSPDGTMLLVTNTMQERNTIFVVRRDGPDAEPPRRGSYARWIAIDRVVFAGPSLMAWRLGAEPTELDGRSARHITVSPDRLSIAADDGRETFVRSPDGVVRTLGPGTSPVWLAATAVAVSRATEGTQRLDFSGPGRVLSLPSTADAAVP